MKKLICLLATVIFLNGGMTVFLVTHAYADREGQTDWWVLKKHWDTCTTKDHDLDLEYMTRIPEYEYSVPHKNPISKVAILPPLAADKFALDSLGYFEKDVLFNIKEMQTEFKITKKWITDKNFRESHKILKENNLYDKYQGWLDDFITYRTIDKDLFSKMAGVLGVDTFLIVMIGYDRPGAASAYLRAGSYYEPPMGLWDIFLFDAKEGKIIWEYACELGDMDDYIMTRWKGLYRGIYKDMPVE